MPGQKFGPAWFPGLIAAGLVLCGALLIVPGVRAGAPWVAFPQWLRRPRARAGVGGMLAGLIAYVLVADDLGFHITGAVILSAWVRLLGASWRLAIATGVIGTVVIHFAFYKALRVPLPWGVLTAWAF